MQITISEPTYLSSAYENIPKTSKWNKDLVTALRGLADRIEQTPQDIYGVDVDRTDSFSEIEAWGSVGMLQVSASPTDYFFVDFSLTLKESVTDDSTNDQELTKELFNELNKFEHEGFFISETQRILDDPEGRFTLRAYFTKQLQA